MDDEREREERQRKENSQRGKKRKRVTAEKRQRRAEEEEDHSEWEEDSETDRERWEIDMIPCRTPRQTRKRKRSTDNHVPSPMSKQISQIQEQLAVLIRAKEQRRGRW